MRRGPFFYIVVLLVPLAAAGIGAGYGISQAVKSRRAWLEGAASEVAVLRVRYADLLARHPDFPLADERTALDAFLSLPVVRQARDLDRGPALVAALRDRCATLAGVDPAAAQASGGMRYRTFSPNGFRAFFDTLRQTDETPPVVGAPITGLAAADARITEMSVKRGYRPRPVADESRLVTESWYQTLPGPLAAFHALRDAARPSGMLLTIVSSYRSIDRQRQNWVSRMGELGVQLHSRQVTAEEVARGEADDVVEAVLSKNAIPGYSKHHTGYAMDLDDQSSPRDFTEFAQKAAYPWLSANNYLNAKRFGFIPSYPVGASNQGPDPEPWEYVWVGEEILREEW